MILFSLQTLFFLGLLWLFWYDGWRDDRRWDEGEGGWHAAKGRRSDSNPRPLQRRQSLGAWGASSTELTELPGRSRLQTSDYASSPHLEQNLYCPHRGIASPPLAKLNSHCGNRCCLQAQCNPCTSQYDQIISLWEADDTEIDSSHNKTRFQWASIISEPVRNDLNMRGILLPTEKKKKKSSRALSVTKAVGTVWCMCPGRLWDSSLCCFMPFVMKGPPSRAHTVKTPC